MNQNRWCNRKLNIRDYGPEPIIMNLENLAKMNSNFRTTVWTGNNLQVTLMSIPVDGDIGIEMHSNLDQFIFIVEGCALVRMGKCKNALPYQQKINHGFGVLIPSDTWHNIINIGDTPLKLYSIYAPPQHPFGTIHETKEDAEEKEHPY